MLRFEWDEAKNETNISKHGIDFDTAQLVGLTHVITLGNLRARFNIALGIGSSGFSDGRVCAR